MESAYEFLFCKDTFEDMVHLENMNEETILENVNKRYQNDVIYTYVSSTLISINPYKKLPIYMPQVLEKYKKNKELSDNPPHIFGIA